MERITGLIEDEVRDGSYDPTVEPGTLGYAIVRLAEAFLFNDATAGMRGDVERLRDVEAAILGVTASQCAPTRSPDPPPQRPAAGLGGIHSPRFWVASPDGG